MTPEQFAEALGRGMMQQLLGAQKPVAARKRGSSSSSPRRVESDPAAAAGATPAAPLQQSMFEPPNAGIPSVEELDKILNISRPDPTTDPPGTYRPGETEVPPWLAR